MYVNVWCICECMCMCLTRKMAPPLPSFPKLVRMHLSGPARPAEPMSSATMDNPSELPPNMRMCVVCHSHFRHFSEKSCMCK